MKAKYGVVYLIIIAWVIYVGATTRPELRGKEHWRNLKKQRHGNKYLQAVFDAVESGFAPSFVVVGAASDPEALTLRERDVIKKLKEAGYAVANIHENQTKPHRAGWKLSLATRKKQSKAKRANPPDNYKDYVFIAPDGTVITTHGLRPLCKKHDLHEGSMSQVASGKRKAYKGWTRGNPSELSPPASPSAPA
jgi:hypothetical protein